MQAAHYLIGDIGGTNARFALGGPGAAGPTVQEPRSLLCADFPTVEDAIGHYLSGLGVPVPTAAVLAIAGPVDNRAVSATNGAWRLSEAGLQAYGFKAVRLLNDYAALGLAIDQLNGPHDLIPIGPSLPPRRDETIAVLGAGTGFGVSAVTRGQGGQAVIATEGGHVAFAPTDEVEIEVLRVLSKRFGRVSIERVLSGPGLVNLYQALGAIAGTPTDALHPADVVERARSGADALCRQAVQRFCRIYGDVAGDFALAFGARGGVFVGGGVALSMTAELREGGFRERFEAKARFQAYVAAIPTLIIADSFAALRGAASVAAELTARG